MKINYIVNGKDFYNGLLAFHESYTTGSPVKFYCNDDQYDRYNWMVEPSESIEVLMDQQAKELRQKYDRLIFFWSGGTDSQTMYNVFKRNNIHIDEIITMGNDRLEYMPLWHTEWIQANHWDPHTIITVLDKFDIGVRSQFVKNENWALENVADLKLFSNGPPDVHTSVAMCERNHNGHNWVMVSGHEKPWLVYQNGQWWSQQKDYALRQTFGLGNKLNAFFLNPKLLIKQAHMLKRALNKLPIKLVNGLRSDELLPSTQGYTIYAQACGRHDELTYGVSALQKKTHKQFISINFGTTGNMSDLNLSTAEPCLIERYSDGDKTALNYVRGLYNVAANIEFVDWLNNFHLISPGQILRTKAVWSKAYCIGN
jgi:hypothetical protein